MPIYTEILGRLCGMILNSFNPCKPFNLFIILKDFKIFMKGQIENFDTNYNTPVPINMLTVSLGMRELNPF